jgi:hypothetical protein
LGLYKAWLRCESDIPHFLLSYYHT